MTDKKITNEDIARKAFNINKKIKNLQADSEDIKKLIKLESKIINVIYFFTFSIF